MIQKVQSIDSKKIGEEHYILISFEFNNQIAFHWRVISEVFILDSWRKVNDSLSDSTILYLPCTQQEAVRVKLEDFDELEVKTGVYKKQTPVPQKDISPRWEWFKTTQKWTL